MKMKDNEKFGSSVVIRITAPHSIDANELRRRLDAFLVEEEEDPGSTLAMADWSIDVLASAPEHLNLSASTHNK